VKDERRENGMRGSIESTASAVAKSESRSLYTIGGVAALLQPLTVVAFTVVIATLGPKPTSGEEYSAIQQSSRLTSILRSDFLTLILIGLYLGTFPALYLALRHVSPVYSALAALFTLIAVTVSFAGESTFSLLRLGDQYAAATTAAQRAQLLAAAEAVIASDLWNSSGAYASGILLQGAGVMISVIMLRSTDFTKVTAYAGLLANGVDLVQHVIHPFAPSISGVLTTVMGPFYLVWFPMLARDLLRLGRSGSEDCRGKVR
jgi:hypothetical protein